MIHKHKRGRTPIKRWGFWTDKQTKAEKVGCGVQMDDVKLNFDSEKCRRRTPYSLGPSINWPDVAPQQEAILKEVTEEASNKPSIHHRWLHFSFFLFFFAPSAN